MSLLYLLLHSLLHSGKASLFTERSNLFGSLQDLEGGPEVNHLVNEISAFRHNSLFHFFCSRLG
jgi:hypothetical protein